MYPNDSFWMFLLLTTNIRILMKDTNDFELLGIQTFIMIVRFHRLLLVMVNLDEAVSSLTVEVKLTYGIPIER